MSETGATPEQIEAAVERKLRNDYPWENDSPRRERVRDHVRADVANMARHLVPPGFKIVPADAVVIDRATADTAAEACERCEMWANEITTARRRAGFTVYASSEADRAARYRAAAAALRGEG